MFDDYFRYELDLDEYGLPVNCLNADDCSQDYCCSHVWGAMSGRDEESFMRCSAQSLTDMMVQSGGMTSSEMWLEMECVHNTMSGAVHMLATYTIATFILGVVNFF